MTTAWDALSDSSRREIVARLAQGELTAGEIAGAFRISRPGVSRHLRVLRDAGLVTVRAEAQRRVYALDPQGLEELDRWRAEIADFWSQRLDALGTEIARGRRRASAGRAAGDHRTEEDTA